MSLDTVYRHLGVADHVGLLERSMGTLS